jgi:DNA polymerase-1
VEELCREAELILDYLRAKGSQGATRTEIQNRVFFNHKTGGEIQTWLRALEEKQLVRYETERSDNGNIVERWFAIQYSGSGPQNPAQDSKKGRRGDEFAMNSQSNAKSSSAPRANPQTNSLNSLNSQEKKKKEPVPAAAMLTVTEDGDAENFIHLANSANSANSSREAAPVKDSSIRNPCELIANSYIYVMKKAQIVTVLAPFQAAPSIALDTETTNDALRLVQLSDGQSPPVILEAQKIDLKAELVPLLKTKKLIVQNSRFDLHVLKSAFGVDIPAEHVFDTFVASALLTNVSVTQEERRRRKRRDWSPNRLESIVNRTLGVELDKSHQDSDWSIDLTLPENAPMLEYAANDVRYLHAVQLHLQGALETEGLLPVYELERDLIPCIIEMSEAGIPIDVDALKRLYAETLEITGKEESRLLKLLRREVNPRSRKKQLLPALQALGLTVDGVPIASTDKKVIPLIDQTDHPAMTAILDWSIANEEAKQLKSWLTLVDQEKDWVWPEINQFGTMTHRFVYKKPNMQQIKKSVLRSIITAPAEELIVRADFKTLELIIAAVLYSETAILEQLARGVDLHTLTASVLFHNRIEDVTKEQRSIGKVTNFSLLYGRSLEEYKRALRRGGVEMTETEMTQAYADFDLAWPNWATHRKTVTVLIGRRTHPKETRSLYGRRILLDASLSNRELRGALLNYAIQSTASDMLKMAILNVWKAKPEGVRVLASVHDEVLLCAPPSKVQTAKALLKEAATEAGKKILKSDVPICLDIGIGKNWWEALQE